MGEWIIHETLPIDFIDWYIEREEEEETIRTNWGLNVSMQKDDVDGWPLQLSNN